MTDSAFRTQMQRMIDAFGAQHYKQERLAMVWKELGALSDSAFTRVVDRLIAESRYAPLLPEFRDAAAVEREQAWRHEKREHKQDAQEFYKSSFAKDEVRLLTQTIIDRLVGKCSDADWASFMSGLDGVIRGAR